MIEGASGLAANLVDYQGLAVDPRLRLLVARIRDYDQRQLVTPVLFAPFARVAGPALHVEKPQGDAVFGERQRVVEQKPSGGLFHPCCHNFHSNRINGGQSKSSKKSQDNRQNKFCRQESN